MAKKQEAEKELKAKEAELHGAETTSVKEKENIESEADSLSIEEIKSKTLVTPSGDFDWDADDKSDISISHLTNRCRILNHQIRKMIYNCISCQ